MGLVKDTQWLTMVADFEKTPTTSLLTECLVIGIFGDNAIFRAPTFWESATVCDSMMFFRGDAVHGRDWQVLTELDIANQLIPPTECPGFSLTWHHIRYPDQILQKKMKKNIEDHAPSPTGRTPSASGLCPTHCAQKSKSPHASDQIRSAGFIKLCQCFSTDCDTGTLTSAWIRKYSP